jgi:hypothetical protein
MGEDLKFKSKKLPGTRTRGRFTVAVSAAAVLGVSTVFSLFAAGALAYGASAASSGHATTAVVRFAPVPAWPHWGNPTPGLVVADAALSARTAPADIPRWGGPMRPVEVTNATPDAVLAPEPAWPHWGNPTAPAPAWPHWGGPTV